MILLHISRHLWRLLLVGGLLCRFLPLSGQQGALKLSTVVIDPGHGGKDAGCISRDGKTREKDLVLDIGKRLSEKIRKDCPDVKVIMTRSDDRFIELYDRSGKANKAGANLFISIHVDAVDTRKNPSWRTVNGYTVYTMGESKSGANMETIKRENAVILLEDDYSTKYQGFDPNDAESYIFFSLMQNANQEQSVRFGEIVSEELGEGPFAHCKGIRQAGFLVLWKSAMPSVLVECGYITSEGDLKILRSEEGRDEIATLLCKAFRKYKREYEGLPEAAPEAVPEAVPEVPPVSGVRYGIQVLASGKKMAATDAFFQGYEALPVPAGNLFKYIVAVSPDEADVRKKLPEVKKKFPGCFLVKIEDDTVILLR